MIDFRVAYDKLFQFETVEELADFFHGEGIHAIPGNGQRCAISQWMTQTTGRPVFTSYFHIDLAPKVVDNCVIYGTQEDTVDITPTMCAFARKFDNMEFPDLVDWNHNISA